MRLKNKLYILGFVSVSTLAAFMPLTSLSSCSKKHNENKVVNHVTQNSDDIKYGLSAKTYSDIKNNYKVKFQDQMISKGIKKGSETWNDQMSQLNTALNSFDQISQNSPMSYTDLTNGVIDYARRTHGLTLRRTTIANFNDIEEEFQGAVEAFKDYAQHQHLPTSQIKQIVNSATSAYKQKLADLEREGYKQNDPYGALLKVRADLFDFFNAGNAVIAKFAGYNKLINFTNNYVFFYKKNTESAYLENIIDKHLAIGQDMTNVFDEIFEIYDNERGIKVDHFDPAAIPGYTITPVYQGLEINKESNVSNIKFSLEILSNKYKNTNDDARIMATAKKLAIPKDKQHFYSEIDKISKIEGKDTPIFTNNYFNLFDIVNETFNVFYSPSHERLNLVKSFFNNDVNERISFVFPAANERTKYESFLTGKRSSDVHKLQIRDLADTGLQISDGKTLVYLSDAIKSLETKQKLEDFDPSTLPFVEKFVYYCNIEGVSTIKDKTTHRVSTDITVSYKNSQNAIESSYIIENLECFGYTFSIDDFMKMSLDYNKANKVYSMYSDISSIKKYRTWDIFWSTYTCLSSAMSIYYTVHWGKNVLKNYRNKQQLVKSYEKDVFKLPHVRKQFSNYSLKYLFSSIALAGASSLLIYEFQKFTRQSCSIYSKINKILNEDYIKQLKPFMNEGKNVFIEMKGSNFDQFDKIERDKKFAEFSNHPEKYDHYCELVDQYKNVYAKDGTFDQITNKYNISLKQLDDFFACRSINSNPVSNSICIISQVISFALNIYLFVVTFGNLIKQRFTKSSSSLDGDSAVSQKIDQLIDDVAEREKDNNKSAIELQIIDNSANNESFQASIQRLYIL